MSNDPNDLLGMAEAALNEGRFDACEALCEKLLESAPSDVRALVLKGVAAHRGRGPLPATELFSRALALDPHNPRIGLWLSMTLHELGRDVEAVECAKDVLAVEPQNPLALHHFGRCLVAMGRDDEAVVPLEHACTLAPTQPAVHYTLGVALQGTNRLEQSVKAFKRSLRLDPNSKHTLAALLETQIRLVDTSGALETARALVALEPDSAELNLTLARALVEDGKAAEAEPYVTKAIALKPDTAEGQFLLGSVLQFLGKMAEADAHFLRSVQIQPDQGAPYLAMVSNRRLTPDDQPLVDTIRNLADDRARPIEYRCQLQYALGKAFDDLGDYVSAMNAFDEANSLAYRMKFGNATFDRAAAEASIRQTLQTFDSDYLSANSSSGSSSRVPIFVVGMVRSGTTLAESILSSHPRIGAAGEQNFWLANSHLFLSGDGSLNAGLLGKFAEKYLKALRAASPEGEHVVDKMPDNYLVLGTIRLAFPNAKIIHVMRHPVDTCISIYATQNRARLDWNHNKANIVFHYGLYQRLMDHWRSVVPAGAMLEVRYEDLVGDLASTSRAMIEFCGLEWHEACLRPDRNRRAVATPSAWQVRQPVYHRSVGRWRNYEPVLGAFRELL